MFLAIQYYYWSVCDCNTQNFSLNTRTQKNKREKDEKWSKRYESVQLIVVDTEGKKKMKKVTKQ